MYSGGDILGFSGLGADKISQQNFMMNGPTTALSTNNSDTSQFMNTSSAGGASF